MFQDGEVNKYVIPHSNMVTIAYDMHHKRQTAHATAGKKLVPFGEQD